MPWEQDVPHAKPAKAAKEETEGKLKPLTLDDASKPGRRNTGGYPAFAFFASFA